MTLAIGMPTNDKPNAANAKPPALASTGLDHACLAHVLGYQLARASVFTRHAFNHAIGEPMQLRPVEFTILELIAHNASATQKQLASALSMTAPGMTVLLDRLEERGLIKRERNESDKRSQFIRLSASGKQLAKRAYEASLRMEQDLLLRLSYAERAMLFELLGKLRS